MQDTPIVLCRRDIDGSSRLWPTRRRWGRRGEAGGLKPDAARTSPRSAGAPASIEASANRAINACAWGMAMPFGQRARGPAKRCRDRRGRFDRRPRAGGQRAGAGSGFCGLEALP